MILIISPKNVYAARRIEAECRSLNVECRILSVEELAVVDFKVDINCFSCLYVRNPYFKGSPKYIPEIVKFAKKFKKAGKKVVDSNIAIGNLGMGKWKDYQVLRKNGVLVPKTFLETKNRSREKLFPFILKWIFGMKAKGTFLIKSEKDLKKIPSFIPKNELMLQEYIEADYEYKVITVGCKALPVVLRFDFNKKFGRVNFNSSKIVNLDVAQARGLPELEAGLGPALQELAEKASKVLGRELAKIDILQKGNKFYVLEVNRFPGLKSFEELTKYNVASDFVSYLHK